MQTFWTVVKNDGPPIYYKRKLFEHEDPDYQGSFAVDFVVHEPYTEVDDTLPIRTTYYTDEEFSGIASLDSRPMLVTLHGLSGGSYEIYLKHVLEPLVGADHASKWEACVINSRGCAKHKITSSILYNARATWDTRQTIAWLRKTFPNRPLFGIGFSLGANILTNVSLLTFFAFPPCFFFISASTLLTRPSTSPKKAMHASSKPLSSVLIPGISTPDL